MRAVEYGLHGGDAKVRKERVRFFKSLTSPASAESPRVKVSSPNRCSYLGCSLMSCPWAAPLARRTPSLVPPCEQKVTSAVGVRPFCRRRSILMQLEVCIWDELSCFRSACDFMGRYVKSCDGSVMEINIRPFNQPPWFLYVIRFVSYRMRRCKIQCRVFGLCVIRFRSPHHVPCYVL